MFLRENLTHVLLIYCNSSRQVVRMKYTGHVENEVVVMELLKTVRDEHVVATEHLLQLGYLQSVHH